MSDELYLPKEFWAQSGPIHKDSRPGNWSLRLGGVAVLTLEASKLEHMTFSEFLTWNPSDSVHPFVPVSWKMIGHTLGVVWIAGQRGREGFFDPKFEVWNLWSFWCEAFPVGSELVVLEVRVDRKSDERRVFHILTKNLRAFLRLQ